MNTVIEVTIGTDGSTRIETKGFAGSSCRAASQFLEKALGLQQSERMTQEFFAQQTSQQQIQEGRQT